jgi:hypothetical protein
MRHYRCTKRDPNSSCSSRASMVCCSFPENDDGCTPGMYRQNAQPDCQVAPLVSKMCRRATIQNDNLLEACWETSAVQRCV